MPPPEAHAALLARRDFPVPPDADLTPSERDLLTRSGRWMEALATGAIAHVTPEQERFVKVACGGLPPTTEFERVWAKFADPRMAGARCFATLAQARATAAAVEADYLAARSAVLDAVRDQLAGVDAAFAERVQASVDAVAKSEAAVRALVLQLGQTVRQPGVQVSYHPGRVTWDPEQMERYAAAHPEVRAFRKVGKPFVSLRYLDPEQPRPPQVRQLPPATTSEPPPDVPEPT
jgi:uncharacterized protein YifE (UPF0438 family)